MKLIQQKKYINFICKECHDDKFSNFILSIKTKVCNRCKRKLYPKHLPHEQFEKYWIKKVK